MVIKYVTCNTCKLHVLLNNGCLQQTKDDSISNHIKCSDCKVKFCLLSDGMYLSYNSPVKCFKQWFWEELGFKWIPITNWLPIDITGNSLLNEINGHLVPHTHWSASFPLRLCFYNYKAMDSVGDITIPITGKSRKGEGYSWHKSIFSQANNCCIGAHCINEEWILI